MRRAMVVAACALLLSACGVQMRVTPLAAPYEPLHPGAPVAVSSVGVPSCLFEELEIVTIYETWDVHGPSLIRVMQSEARSVGGHAIVGLREIYDDEGAMGLSGTVIRFTDPDCMS